MRSLSLGIVIPALDAARWLGEVLDECQEMRSATGLFSRILVVDDGSTDETTAVAESREIEVVRHDHNLGKGAALRTGLRKLVSEGCEAVLTLDADGQHLPADAPRFVEAWLETGADLVVGSRRHLFGEMLRRRRLANQFSARTISIASGLALEDSQSGYRLYSRRFVETIRFVSDGFSAESEMLVAAGLSGFRVEQIPIQLGFVDGVGTSHYAAVKDTIRIAARVVATTIWYRALGARGS